MNDARRPVPLMGIIISLLAGMTAFLLFGAASAVTVVLDQHSIHRFLPALTECVITYRPKGLVSIASAGVGVTATFLFLAFRLRTAVPVFLGIVISFFLVVVSYILFFVLAVADSQIYITQTPTPHATPSSIEPRIWASAVFLYSLVLLAGSLVLARRQREANNTVQPTRASARVADL